jgi:hypothetical protein
MRHVKVLGFCLAAVFALSAMLVASASAASPEYEYYNTKTKTDEPLYPPSGTKKAQKIAYTNAGLKRSKLEGGVVIECEKDTGKGDIEGPAKAGEPANKTVKLKVTYTECEAPAISSSCQKSPRKPGVIITQPLKGELVYASEKSGGSLIVGNKLTPEKAPAKPEFAKFTCGPKKELSVIVTGVIIARPEPINAASSETGESINAEKSKEEGANCSKQQLLFINGSGLCQHLDTAAGTSWNVSEDEVKYKRKKVKIKG